MTKSIKLLTAIALSSAVAAAALASHLSTSTSLYHRAPTEVPVLADTVPAIAPVEAPMAQVIVTGHRMSEAEKAAFDATNP